MYPGLSTYALFSVQTTPGSMAGYVRVQAPTWENDTSGAGGLAEYLQYGIVVVDGNTCNESSFLDSVNAGGEYIVVPRETDLQSDEPTMNEQYVAANSGSTVNYCLELTLPAGTDDDAQGESVEPQWEFHGTSTVDG